MFLNTYKGKRVLVTGHTGFKGSWLCQWLLNLGAEVAGYSDTVPTEPSHFEVLGLPEKITHYTGDIRNLKSLTEVFAKFKPEFVFHLAAQPLVFESYNDPLTTLETNVMGTANLLEAIRHAPSVRAGVIATSDKCYLNVEQNTGYVETDRLGGKDPYSASKACAELVFYTYWKSFFEKENRCALSSARAGNVIGGGDWAKDRVIPDCVRAWSKGEKVSIRNPQSTRPWQHVLEPLSGYLWLCAKLAAGTKNLVGEGFNFGPSSEKRYTVLQVLEDMQKTWKLDRAFEITAPPGAPKEAGLLELNCDRSEERLGWLPTLSLKETIEMTGTWYRTFYENRSDARELTLTQIAQFEKLGQERKREWIKQR